jgi:hypothetical protein
VNVLKITIQKVIEQHKNLLTKREEEVKRLEYLWNVKKISPEFSGELPKIDNEIREFLTTEIEMS